MVFLPVLGGEVGDRHTLGRELDSFNQNRKAAPLLLNNSTCKNITHEIFSVPETPVCKQKDVCVRLL